MSEPERDRYASPPLEERVRLVEQGIEQWHRRNGRLNVRVTLEPVEAPEPEPKA